MKPVLRRIGRVLALALGLLIGLVAALWLWTGAEGSLGTALNQAARWLPAGQTLTASAVSGTLRDGGQLGELRWQNSALTVQARDVRLRWSLRALLDGELRIQELTLGQLRIDDQRAPSAPTPLTSLQLPLTVQAAFAVAQLDVVGASGLHITEVNGHYVFDSKEHRMDKLKARISSANYTLQARLQAQAPMALALQLRGALETGVPSSAERVTVQAQADVSGTLAGPDASLNVQAALVPTLTTPASARAAPLMQADLKALIRPWQAQPLASVQAHWQALDVAALWPQAPQTQLAGTAHITPTGTDWRGQVELSNTRSGPWNEQRLPLQNLKAALVFANGQWTLESLQADGAGARIDAKATLNRSAATPDWQAHAKVRGLNPAALDSRLAASVLNGELNAQQHANAITFDVGLQATPGATQAVSARSQDHALLGLRLQTLQAQGLWQAHMLTLKQLTLHSNDAQLQGQLSVDTLALAVQGQLSLTLPGAQATLNGDMASSHGQGKLNAHIDDAASLTRWLARWPGGASAWLKQNATTGRAELTGQWQGGWQQQGQALQLTAQLRVPQLEVQPTAMPAAPAWQLRDGQVDASGTLAALTMRLRAQAQHASRQFSLQSQAHGGLTPRNGWQLSLDSTELSTQDPPQQPGVWKLTLNQPVLIEQQQTERQTNLSISAGAAQLSGPSPGSVTVDWQALRWSQAIGAASKPAEWQSQGRVQGIPLAWLGAMSAANLSVRGDLIFGGQWQASGGAVPRVQVSLARSSGDLQLQSEEGASASLRAGVRQASAVINMEGEQLSARLNWDSERAGQVQAQLASRLQQHNGAWTWPLEAPLSGSARAQLPSTGIWSALAPPGWRLRGTLDAEVGLSGHRGAPAWRGTLRAQEVALRSVVNGIDLSHGSLQARFDEQQFELLDFSVRGSDDNGQGSGGRLSLQGALRWPADASGSAAALTSRLQMELKANLQALRVNTRPDQRLLLSGQLNAQLAQARLNLTGALRADQALFILPENSTPQLGDDVRVRTAQPSGPPPAPKAPAIASQVNITLDLGLDFQLRGHGLTTRLTGNLTLRSGADTHLAPRLNGEVRTARGTYKAYGQQLDIRRGVLRFDGAYDNPTLNILAIRPNLQQRVGVQINGTALAPAVRLYADPELPDAEKLGWLVMGRAPGSGGTESAMLQQAALALLGGGGQSLSGNLAQTLGLDELSVRSASSSGEANSATGATVTLGKRVSQDFYVAYERSLAGTVGTFYLFYDLSRRFTLRAQTGEQSAIDLIFTLRYD